MNRGAGRRVTFHDDRERRWFVDLLSEIDHRFGVEVHAFCLMGNHYHLLLRSRTVGLSDAMQWLSSSFTRRVNEVRGVDGPLFRGRFHSVPVEREAHLINLLRYVNANPVDLGWSGPLIDYPWSGMRAARRLTDESKSADLEWVHVDLLAATFGSLESFVRFVEQPHDPYLAIEHRPAPPFDEIEAAVSIASGLGPSVDSLSRQRTVTMLLAVETAGLSADQVAERWGTSTAGAAAFLTRARGRRVRDRRTLDLHERARLLLVDPNCALVSDTIAQLYGS